jgi:molecular chaperone DnaJ
MGGPKGDLYVILSIRPHDFFRAAWPRSALRDSHQLSAGGAGRRIRDPRHRRAGDIKIPEGTQSGKELRVRGRGVPYLNEKGHGDLIVKVVVQIPRKLSRAQRDLVAKLGETMAWTTSRLRRG